LVQALSFARFDRCILHAPAVTLRRRPVAQTKANGKGAWLEYLRIFGLLTDEKRAEGLEHYSCLFSSAPVALNTQPRSNPRGLFIMRASSTNQEFHMIEAGPAVSCAVRKHV